MTALFKVHFHGDEPEEFKVGDKVNIAGTATITSIRGDLVDVTSVGKDPEFVLGELEINLAANKLTVELV